MKAWLRLQCGRLQNGPSVRPDFGTGVRVLSYDAVDATERQAAELRAANDKQGYACTLCCDTGLRPAPAPYGLIGAKWACTCPAGAGKFGREHERGTDG